MEDLRRLRRDPKDTVRPPGEVTVKSSLTLFSKSDRCFAHKLVI